MLKYISVLKVTAINYLQLALVEIDIDVSYIMGAEEEFSAFTNAEEHISRIQILLITINERAIIIIQPLDTGQVNNSAKGVHQIQRQEVMAYSS